MAKQKKACDIHGILLLNKPTAMTSNTALQKIKRFFGANKAGHTGTLDPLATGMLPICFGEATKFSNYLLESDKRYLVTAKLGIRTDTSDSEGQIIQEKPVLISLCEITQKMARFRGKQKQLPTMFSALKYQGRPLYEYARQGLIVPRHARNIEVYGLKLLRFDQNELKLDIHCSKGTYIRTIIDDLGEELGCGAHVTALYRSQVANFPVDKMLTFNDLNAHGTDQTGLMKLLLSVDSAVKSLPKIVITPEQGKDILYGRSIFLLNGVNEKSIRMYINQDNNEYFIGIGTCQSGQLLPKRLIAH